MKESTEFPGWFELEPDDFIEPYDVIIGGDYSDPNSPGIFASGSCFMPGHPYFRRPWTARCREHSLFCRYFRRKNGRRFFNKSSHAKPLPLP